MQNFIKNLNKAQIFRQLSIITILLFTSQNSYSQCGFDININQTNNACNQTNNGSLDATIQGPGVYNDIFWTNGIGDTISNTLQANNLENGAYLIYVTDSMNICTQYSSRVITGYFNSPSILSNPVTCSTCEDGLAEVIINNTNINFLWDDTYIQTTQIANDLAEGFYSVIISDVMNCTEMISTEIEDCGSSIEISYIATPPSCINCNDAILTAIVSGGNGSYNYLWDDSLTQTTPTAFGLDYHDDYMVTITDSLGCENTLFIDSNAFCRAAINPNITVLNQPNCYTCQDGAAFVSPNLQFGPPNIFWPSVGSNNDTIDFLLPGDYEVIISDGLNCQVSSFVRLEYCFNTINITQDSFTLSNQNTLTDSVIGNDNFNPLEFNSCVLVSGANQGHVILNADGSFNYTIKNSFTGTDFFSYSIFTDCGYTDTVNAYISVQNPDLVWPGDANNNGIVDNFDLLPISVFHSSTGAIRTGASNNYFGQFANDFGPFQINGVDIKHADCDGSGNIDSLDLLALDINYDPNHSYLEEGIEGFIPLEIIAPDTIAQGDTVEFKIILGTSNIDTSSLYAIAYTFNINKDIINQNYYEARFNDSWLTPDNNRISFSKGILSKGRIDIAQGGKDGLNKTGGGEIGSIIIVIEEDLDDIIISDFVTLNRVRLIQNDETQIYVKKDTTSFVLTEIDDIETNDSDIPFSFSPNPCQEKLNISFEETGDYEIELINVIGEIIFSTSLSNTKEHVLQSDFANGIYFLKAKQNGTESIQKVMFYK